MKINAGLLSLVLAGFSSLASAQPHGKQIRGAHGRHVRALQERNVVVETMTEYRYTTVEVAPGYTPKVEKEKVDKKKGDNKPVAPSPTTSSSPPLATPTGKSKSDPGSGSGDSGIDTNPNTGIEFPSGVVPCNKFPSDYGAVPLPWFNPHGWSGIQIGNANGDKAAKCVESAYCSYACPAGYSKAQWPAEQPSNGESRGGLLCQNGLLTLTRPEYKYLCQAGEPGIFVQNEMSETVSVCRTDYPGSENMVIPLQCDPGTSRPLAVPDSANSYMWQGKKTSAQYYVNKAGIAIKDACKWGDGSSGVGNWAPMIFGAGKDGGLIWLSISQNQLWSGPLGYNVAIIGGSMKCEYVNGQFTQPGGCTVAVQPGQKAYFRLWK